jgi:hypothetical protein
MYAFLLPLLLLASCKLRNSSSPALCVVYVVTAICYPTKDLEVHLLAYLNFYVSWNDDQVRVCSIIHARDCTVAAASDPHVCLSCRVKGTCDSALLSAKAEPEEQARLSPPDDHRTGDRPLQGMLVRVCVCVCVYVARSATR